MGYMPLVWYLAVLGVNTPFKFAVFVREGAAPLPCIKGDRDSDRPWGQISQNQSKNDKKGKNKCPGQSRFFGLATDFPKMETDRKNHTRHVRKNIRHIF